MSLVNVIQKDGKAAKWTGIFMIIAGFLSLLAPLAAGLSVTVIAGIGLLVAGVVQIIMVFRANSFGEGLLLVLLGILSLVAGGYMLVQPAAALAGLTLFLAAYFIAGGVIEIFGAFGARPAKGWGWILFSGIVAVLLGVMIWQQFPFSGAWAVGTLVGVRLLFGGWALVAIGGMAQSVGTRADAQR